MLANAVAALSLFLAPIDLSLNEISQFEVPAQNTTRIYLVRHGQSAFNVADENGVFYTSGKGLSVPLTQDGRQQATNLGKKLVGKLPNVEYVILSSTAVRAQDTANLIFDELKSHYSIQRGESYDEFCELDKGIWEGKPKDAEYNVAMGVWKALSAKEKFSFPVTSTAESYNEVGIRFLAGLQKVTNIYQNKTIILATHNAAMNALAFHLSGRLDELSEEPASPFPSPVLGNCDMLVVEFTGGEPIEKAKVTMHIITEFSMTHPLKTTLGL